jgi:hypothetical protein
MDMSQLPDWAPYALGSLYVGLEYWLGKTTKVAPSSVLEAILAGVGAVFKVLSKKDGPKA